MLHYFHNTRSILATDLAKDKMIDEKSSVNYALTKSSTFIGYTFIDPTNVNPYLDIVLCTEGTYYDTVTSTCQSKIYYLNYFSFVTNHFMFI